jgi:hypothetical protein
MDDMNRLEVYMTKTMVAPESRNPDPKNCIYTRTHKKPEEPVGGDQLTGQPDPHRTQRVLGPWSYSRTSGE